MGKPKEIETQLKALIEEDLKVVTYKWLARQNNIPVNLAKQHLFAYAEGRRGKVNATYLLAGWTKEPQHHVIQLVDESKLQEAKKALLKVTSLHVYSIQPTQPKDPADFWNAEVEQTSSLFDQMVKKMQENCLSTNSLSAVTCAEAERDPDIAKKLPAPPQPEAAQPAKKPASGAIGAKIDGIMAGRTANRGGVASSSVAVGTNNVADNSMTNGPASAPAGGPSGKDSSGAGKEARVDLSQAKGLETGAKKGQAKSMAAAKGKASALGNMWSKAPAKSAKQPKSNLAAPSLPSKAVDAQAQLQAQAEESGSDDEDEDDFVPARRTVAKAVLSDDEDDDDSRKQDIVNDDDDDSFGAGMDDDKEDDTDTANQSHPAKRAAAPPKTKTAADGNKAAKASKAKQTAVKRKPLKQLDPADGEEDQSASGQEPDSQPAKAKFGSVKAGAPAGAKRRKVQQTIINDDGEEVTEAVWEEIPSSHPQKDLDLADEEPAESQSNSQASEKAVSEIREPSIQKAARTKGPKSGKQSAGQAKGNASKKSTTAAKSGAAQKNIMSFFGKK